MPYDRLNPYADILAERAARRANRVAPKLSLRFAVLDNGAPSADAMRARDARLAAAVDLAEQRAATAEFRGDHRCLFGYAANPATSTKRRYT